MPQERFRDRRQAGQLLAKALAPHYKGRDDVIVLGLPRGGVPVAYEIANELNAPLDVFVVRKLGVPWHPELAMGAIASDGVEILNGDVVTAYNIPPNVIRAVAEREGQELQRRLQQYRGNRPLPELTGRTVILVDDGLATGSTMRAAVAAVRQQNPRAVVVAVPVAALDTCYELRPEVDDIICLRTPRDFSAVGLWYEDFSQTSDEEVRQLLSEALVTQPTAH
jgi:predicted phosphoribosyltransferase